ncbi:MAG: riboflavin synthase [Solirubrobacterales bacterium]|nr:riboflavin synthase [Solirubrobacterales bacterium]
MFTGLIEELGTIAERRPESEGGAQLVISASFADELKAGDSVAVNGVCLTAMNPGNGTFSADAMAVTLDRSSLGDLEPGGVVNLERALRADGRLGGHIVQGHVDGVGTVMATKPDGNALVVSVEAPSALMRYMVPKGSIALDGVSLTLAEVREDGFDVWLIPETCERTRIGSAEVGMRVNLEVDILAKYVEKLNSPN